MKRKKRHSTRSDRPAQRPAPSASASSSASASLGGHKIHGRGKLRIVAGTLRGRLIATVPDRRVRPMPERMRTALFNALESRDWLSGAHVLDAFAGSGAMGIEAISRGAAVAVFCERDRTVFAQLQENLRALNLTEPTAQALLCDVLRDGPTRLAPLLGPFPSADLTDAAPPFRRPPLVVFFDPPYDLLRTEHYAEFVARASALMAHVAPPAAAAAAGGDDDSGASGTAASDGARPRVCVVLGHDFDVEIPPALAHFERRETRAYGRTHLTFYGTDWA